MASKTKAVKVVEGLKQSGITPQQLARLRFPAGLNIKATSPEEIAVSILAEIIQVRGEKLSPLASDDKVPAAATLVAKDPICGMTVTIADARFKADYQDSIYYFCCAGCRKKFEAEPTRYLATSRANTI